MKKIYFFCSDFPPKTGGEIYDYKIYSYLQAQGLQVKIISPWLKIGNSKIRSILESSIGAVLQSLVLIFKYRKLSGVFIEDEITITRLWFFNLIQRFIKKNKIVFIIHHLDSYTDTMRKKIRRILNSFFFLPANVAVVVSSYTKMQVLKAGLSEDKISLIPNGLDREKLIPICKFDAKLGDLNILFVGHCIYRKGIHYLLDAFAAILQNQSVKSKVILHIVGSTVLEPDYYAQIQQLIEKRGIQENVVIHGRVDNEKLNYLYSTADIFALPSLEEGFGVVFLEAMYFGLPIVTFNLPPILDLIKNGENGFVVPRANVVAFSQALLTLIGNDELRRKIKQSNLAKVQNGFYWEETCSSFLRLIQKLCSSV